MISAARINLGHKSLRFSTNKLMHKMGWLNLKLTLQVANARMTHQMVNFRIPEFLTFKFDPDLPNQNGKPRKKPANFGKTRVAKSQYRFMAYKIYKELPDWLTKIKKTQNIQNMAQKIFEKQLRYS